MGIFISLVKKESLHIVRDTRTMVITLLMPVVLLLLFGFAISTEVKAIRVGAVVDTHTPQSRELLQRIAANDNFIFLGTATPTQADSLLRRGECDVILNLRTDNGQLLTQIETDASNTTIAQTATGYLSGIIVGNTVRPSSLTATLYNPQLKSSYNFVPGIMGMIFILICAIMTSVSIVREKETGTMNLLLVSPVRPHTIILGKLLPYFLLSCLILVAMLVMAYTLLGLPFYSGVWLVAAVSVIYILLSLAIGLLVSAIVETQLTALIVSAVMFMLPVIMLSGMIFPIDNMPKVLQWASSVIPARWYIEAMRKLMVEQLTFTHIWKETLILGAMTLLLLILSIKKFNK